MARFCLLRRGPTVLAICAIIAFAGAGSTRASVISSTPTLPLLNVPYVSSIGAGCFPAAGVCVSPGTFTLTSVVSSTFDPAGQNIVTTIDYAGTLTNLSNVPIGPVLLSGTTEQLVKGRTFSTETGSWVTDLVGLLLSGPIPVLGATLTLGLDPTPGNESTGVTSITPIDEVSFKIDSFFDVFVELTLDTPTPLQAMRGPIRVETVPVPEPASLALLAAPVLMLAAIRRRKS